MIVDGFDYGDGWTNATAPGPLVEWLSESREWKSRPGIHLQLFRGEKYRRPMTESEKQAEKAKEKKVTHQHFVTLQALHYSEDMVASIKPRIPLSEAARIAQLPEVMDEVERLRKEKEININDWFWASHAVRKCGVKEIGQIHDYAGGIWTDSQCRKIKDPAFIAMLEAGATP